MNSPPSKPKHCHHNDDMQEERNASTNITCIGNNVRDSCLINNFEISLADSYLSDDGEKLNNNLANCILRKNEIIQYFHTESVNVNSHLAQTENEAELCDNVIIISDSEDDLSCEIIDSFRYEGTQSQYEEVFKENISKELDNRAGLKEIDNDHITSEMIKNKIDVPKICQSESMDLELNYTLDEMNKAFCFERSVSKQGEETEKELKSAEPECPRIHQERDSFNDMANPQLLTVLSEIQPLNDFRNKDDLSNPANPSIKLNAPLNQDRSKELEPMRTAKKQPLRRIRSPIPKYPKYNFKNIKSPVGVYIKNSPSASLQQNAKTSRISRLPAEKTVEKTAEKVCKSQISLPMCLPSVVYKPAHYALLTKERGVKLPANIEKFIPMKPTITKHEARIVNSNRGCKNYVSSKLEMDSDLTQSSIDDASQDVSILTSKKTFIS